MKKSILKIPTLTAVLLIGLGAISLTSCKKDEFEKEESSYSDEISTESTHLRLANSNYEMVVVEPLQTTDNYAFFTKGKIEYKLDGETVATVDYGNGEKNSTAILVKDGELSSLDLEQKEKPSKFKKVIVEPLVVSEDCGFIVSGIIKYYKADKWIATIDFGDGTCDDIATKKTNEGDFVEFTVSEYF